MKTRTRSYSYDVLAGGSPRRLAKYRRKLEKSLSTIRGCRTPEDAEKFIQSEGYTSPLNHRYSWTGDTPHNATFSDCGGYANLPASMLSGLRDAGESERAYYRDSFADETYRGRVWQLPARNGETQFIAGYLDEPAAYVRLDATRNRITIFDDKDDAMRAADHVAERDAEAEREHDERWQAAREHDEKREDCRETMAKARAEARGLVLVLRELPQSPEARAIICGHIRKCRDRMRACVRTIQKETAAIVALDMEGEF